MTIRRLFVDLDDTLIHTMMGRPGQGLGHRKVVESGVIKESGKPETFHSAARPSCMEILARCRALGETWMLTTALRKYAEAHNEAFALGFAADRILAREDYLVDCSTPYGSDTLVTSVNTFPHSILIDNLPADSTSSKMKLLFLGKDSAKYAQIREYDGGKDPEKFRGELEEMFEKIARWLAPKKAVQEPGIG